MALDLQPHSLDLRLRRHQLREERKRIPYLTEELKSLKTKPMLLPRLRHTRTGPLGVLTRELITFRPTSCISQTYTLPLRFLMEEKKE